MRVPGGIIIAATTLFILDGPGNGERQRLCLRPQLPPGRLCWSARRRRRATPGGRRLPRHIGERHADPPLLSIGIVRGVTQAGVTILPGSICPELRPAGPRSRLESP